MESEKRPCRNASKTSLYICIGFLSLALIASLALSFYTLVSLNSLKDSLTTQYHRPIVAEEHQRRKRQSDGEDDVDGEDEPQAAVNRTTRYIGTVEEEQSGAIYTRWGALGCAKFATPVYVGEVASAYWHLNGGTNYLCIPAGGMQWLGWNQNVTASSLLMGTDYETSLYGDQQLFVNQDLNDRNVPCAVCQATRRLSQLMIPGKTSCPDATWRIEYLGYIMTTTDTTENQSEFICVDVFATPYPVNEGNSIIGSHLVHVKGFCRVGSGDIWGCAAHEHNREIACVVCSK